MDEAEMVDIEEGRRAITTPELLGEIERKWKEQLEFTTEFRPAAMQTVCRSPFKSVQTDTTTHPRPPHHSHTTQQMYFGFDREWTRETVQFFKHRLQSLLRTIHQAHPRLVESEIKHP